VPLFVRLGCVAVHKGIGAPAGVDPLPSGADQVIALGTRAVSDVPLFQRVRVTGRLDAARQFLLDNRTYRGAPGTKC